MEALIVIVVLLALGFWHADRKKVAEDAKIRMREAAFEAEAAREVEEREQIEADLISIVGQHERTLLMKERQLTFTDDYGQVDQSAFVKELEYFFERVVPFDLQQRFVVCHDRHATLMAVSAIRIYLHEVARDHPGSELQYEAGMTGVQFERLVADRLVGVGADVRFTPVTGDQGADLIVQHNGQTIVIQCKRSGSTVGNKAVQEAYAGRKFHDAEQAWVVSDAPFSRSARQLASSLSVRLVDFDQVEAAL